MDLHQIGGQLNQRESFLKAYVAFARVMALSLREMERSFVYITMFFIGCAGSQRSMFWPIAILLAIIKVVRPQVFESLFEGRLSFGDLQVELGLFAYFGGEDTENDPGTTGASVGDWLKFAMLDEASLGEGSSFGERKFLRFEEMIFHANEERTDIVRTCAHYMAFYEQ